MTQPLVVRHCNYIGDVVLSVPALSLLQSHGYTLHLYGKGWASTLLSGYSWPVTPRTGGLLHRVGQLQRLRSELFVSEAANASVKSLAMPNSFSSALELRLAGLRPAGYARDGRGLLLSRRLPADERPHALESFWQLACGLTGYQGPAPRHIGLKLTDRALEAAHTLIQKHAWSDGYVCVAPFCAGLVDGQPKRWPGFPELVSHMHVLGWPIVICPGPGEMADAQASFPGAHLLENLPLDTYAALLARSRLVVANDTGPAHIAAAVGAHVVSVLGPTKVEQWSPWGLQVEVLSERPQFPIVERVLHAVSRYLA